MYLLFLKVVLLSEVPEIVVLLNAIEMEST